MNRKKAILSLAFALFFSLGLNAGSRGRPAQEAVVKFDVAATPFLFAEGGKTKQVLRVYLDSSVEFITKDELGPGGLEAFLEKNQLAR